MDIGAYLKRLNYDGPTDPSADVLQALQVAHLLSVPFENLSIHAHEPIVLDDESLFAKIVERRRGGFCYELNGLFAALLRALGFKVEMLSAEVPNAQGEFSEPFDHMTLLVSLQQRWLVDVGFGDSFVAPLRIDQTSEQKQQHGSFRIAAAGSHLVLDKCVAGAWRTEYRFTLQPYQFKDFAAMCVYHQTSPHSQFTQKRICSRLTAPGARITLSKMRFIETSSDGQRRERTLSDEEEYRSILKEHFGIVM